MALKAIHDALDEIPEEYQTLYTEKEGKYELTGIAGIKTEADVTRIQTSLHKSQQDNKDLKSKFAIWDDMDHEQTMTLLDRIPELEAAAKGKLDEAGIEEIVQRRVSGTLKSQTAPLERQIATLTKENGDLSTSNTQYQKRETTQKIHRSVRSALTATKVISEAQEDALMLADRIFEVAEDGMILTKDGVGVTPGMEPKAWLEEIQEKRPHWWPANTGGGARGSTGGGIAFSNNPWSERNWNITDQGKVVKEKGIDKAHQMAAAAGSVVGSPHPPKAVSK